MTLRIERSLAQDRAVIRLIGRMQRECLADLEAEIESTKPKPTLDLREVTLVDVEAVSFLITCQDGGVALLHCSPYIRRWMTRERAQRG
jgi:ABC-type transporter Mla MlaB component